jgi:hypothetical protein
VDLTIADHAPEVASPPNEKPSLGLVSGGFLVVM